MKFISEEVSVLVPWLRNNTFTGCKPALIGLVILVNPSIPASLLHKVNSLAPISGVLERVTLSISIVRLGIAVPALFKDA